MTQLQRETQLFTRNATLKTNLSHWFSETYYLDKARASIFKWWSHWKLNLVRMSLQFQFHFYLYTSNTRLNLF